MIAPELRAELEAALPGAIRFDVDASRLTSLRVGGPADALATPPDRASLAALLRICARRRLAHRVIGRGFNTIVRDEGVDGVLIQLGAFKRLEERPDGCLRVEAGVSHASLTRFCRERGLAGLEYGAGIPGSIGGWIAMNAGIPDRETRHVVRELEVMSPNGARLSHLPRERLGFRYRAHPKTVEWYVNNALPGGNITPARLTTSEVDAATFPDDVFMAPIIGIKDEAGDAALNLKMDWWGAAQYL